MTPSLVWIYLFILVVALSGAGFILYRRWQSRRALVARLDELSKFADAGQRILNAPFDLHLLAQRIYIEAGEIVDVSIFQLGLFDGDRYRLLIWIMDGEARPLREFSLTPNSLGIVGWMRESRRSLLVRDFEKEIDSLPAKPRYISDDPPRSAAFVPLMVGDAVLGVMAIQNRQPDAFSEEDLRLLSIIANHAAAALQNARLLDQAQRRATQLELLSEVAQQINALQSLPALYSQIVNLIAEKFSEYHVSFFEIEGEQLNLRATTNPDHIGKTITIRVGDDIAGEAAATGEPIIKQELPEYMRAEEESIHPHSTLVVPVSIGKRVLGVLEIRSHALFDDSAVSVFRSLASQIAIAILEAQTYIAEQRRADQLAALARASRTVVSVLDLDDIFDEVLDLIEERFQYKHVHVFLLQGEQLVHRAGTGKAASRWLIENPSFPINGKGLITLAARKQQGVLVADTSTHPDYIIGIGQEATRSEMVAPMLMAGHVLGVIDVQSPQLNAFTQDDLQTLQTLADTLAVAIRNARLFAGERRRRRLAEILREVSNALISTVQLDDVLEFILDALALVTQYDVASILLINEHGSMSLRSSRGPAHLEDLIGESFNLKRFESHKTIPETVVFHEVDQGHEYHDRLAMPEPHACLGSPLVIRNEHLGYLVVDRAGRENFPPEEIELIAAFASQAAVAIENARLYASQQEEAWINAALLQVAEAVAASPSLDVSLQTVSRLTTMLVGVDRVAIYQRNEADSNFHLTHHEGLGDAASTLQRSPLSPSVLGVNESHVAAAALHTTLPPDLASAFGCDQGMVWSLWARGELLGALVVEQGHALGKRLQILDGIAHQLSMAMENARLAREVAVQQRLEREMEVGRDIQASFLPDACPLVEGWSVCAYWQAARQVGGDFYDFIQLRPDDDGNERWGIVIADVADKGVPAALFMALSRTLLRSVAINRISPATTLERVNQLILSDARSNLFVTIFYAVWTPRTGQLVYANGGHNPPLLIRAQKRNTKRMRSH
ncbi:MAG: GAF domain-containing protein [Chloroflexi bacterium]|nr:GAF domain-containing protein [Chloroflexota bacterium]